MGTICAHHMLLMCLIKRRDSVFKWALIFAVLALVAALAGFGGMAGAFAGIAKILFFVGLALVVIFLFLAITAGKKITGG